jgi:hypothetical protein
VHPFTLPFDLFEEEARVYLNHLGVPRFELLELFTADQELIARERLGLTQRAWNIIIGTALDPVVPLAGFWGLTSTSTLSQVPVFLKQSGLTFEELRELLATAYLADSSGDPIIEMSPGCDIASKSLTGLTDCCRSSKTAEICTGRLVLS